MEEKDINPKTIRTYESDIANAIQHRSTSQASIVIASEEKNRNEENILTRTDEKKSKNWGSFGKNILIIIISLILFAAGIGVVYYFYTISPLSVQQPSTPPTVTTSATVASIITPDIQKIIDVTGQTNSQLINQIQKEIESNNLPSNSILGIVLGVQASTTQNGKTTTVFTGVTGPQFISMIGLVPPNGFTSSLANQWMLGAYSSTDNSNGTTSEPFVIFTNNFFQNAFAGMLSWETTMPYDFSSIFGLKPTELSGGNFHDKLIKNKNTREFTDTSGNILFLYSFIDNNTLVIAKNEATLSEIIDRFEKQGYVR